MEPAQTPLITTSWLRDHAKDLSRLQIEGELCCYCGGEVRTMVPVGTIGARQLFACYPACSAAHGDDRP